MTNGFQSRLWISDYNGSEQDTDDGSEQDADGPNTLETNFNVSTITFIISLNPWKIYFQI